MTVVTDEMRDHILALAEGLYPINEDTKVVKTNRGVSIKVNGSVLPLKMQDKLEGFWAEYVETNNTIYIAEGGGTWTSSPDSGYQKWRK